MSHVALCNSKALPWEVQVEPVAPLRLNYKAACISVITAGTFRTNHLFTSLPSQSGLGWGEIGKAALALQTSPVKITKPPQLKELNLPR